MKWWSPPAIVALTVAIALASALIYVGFFMRPPQPDQAAGTPVSGISPVTEVTTLPPETTPVPETTPPTPETTPVPTPTPRVSRAVPATPIRDASTYNAPDFSTYYNPKERNLPVIFQQSYKMDFQYEAVVVEALKSPLIIDFAVSPGSSSPIRSFFLITVRDNSTQKVLAQDGYFRTYSSDSPKRLIFSSAGTYHINMHGSFVTVQLTVKAPL